MKTMIGVGGQRNNYLCDRDPETSKKLEPCLYFGRSHQIDHLTDKEVRGVLKIGRAKYTRPIFRGRNQSGAEFRMYAKIHLYDNDATKVGEKVSKKLFKFKNFTKESPFVTQGQTELYDIKDEEIEGCVLELCEALKCENIKVRAATIYYNDEDSEIIYNKDIDPSTIRGAFRNSLY